MKKHLLMKTLLVALVCLVGGTSSVWAVDNMTTMTGQLGLTDNSAPAWTYYTKTATIKAGETYTYTFQNFTKGNEATFEYQTWIAEVRENDTNYCLDARGDGGGWSYDNSTSVLAYNYTGKAWNEGGRSLSDFMTAYNNVTVTLTISCSNDGKEVTIARTATLNGDTDFSGTWTCSNFAGNDKTINLIVEASHLNITKVAYTNASGVVTNYERTDVDLSAFDANSSYSEGTASFTLGSSKWSKLDLSSYYSGITGTITNINLSFTENIGTGGRMCFGIFGSNKSAWGNGMPETANSVSIWGVCGSSNANRVYYGNNSNVNTLTPGSEKAIEMFMDMVNKRFTFVQAGTTLVNNQSFIDTEITSPRYFAGHTWTNESNATTLKNMSMEIVYVEASYYTATFTNTTSSNTPTVTIYTDSERTSEISNGLLEDGETYYFTAVEEGYQNYNGSFTVSGADPAVDFAMTAKTVYNYTVNAVDGEDHIIKENIASGSCYANESTSFYLPSCVLVGSTLHFMAAEASYKSESVTENNQVFSYPYTTNSVDNVVFYVEGENISGASTSTPTGNQQLASKGYMGRGSNLTLTTLPVGVYTIYVKYINTNNGAHSLLVKAGDTNVINADDVTARPTKSGSITLTEPATITLTAAASSTSGVDYLYIVKTGVPVTVTSAGYATYVSANNLDFTSTGIKAYTAKVNDLSKSVVLTQINKVPAGTPVILYKEGGATENVPVATSTDTPAENDLIAGTGAAVATDGGDGKINYILNNVSGIGFYKAAGQIVDANRAYLQTTVDAAAARMTMIFEDDDVTGVNEVRSQKEDVRSEWFDLQGRKVAQPQKGLYIVNGKKVVLK